MRKISNNASTITLDDIDAEAGSGPITLTFAVDNSQGQLLLFPDVDTIAADYAYCTLENTLGQVEICKLTSVNIIDTTVTVQRGSAAFPPGHLDAPSNGIAPNPPGMLAFPAGSRFECRPTAGLFQGMLQRDGDTVHGGVFGDTPEEPELGSSTIITKHSTADNNNGPAIGNIQIGELAFNAKTGKLYAGAVNAADAKVLLELVPGIYYGSAEPEEYQKSRRTLWYQTTDGEGEDVITVNTLKLWTGSAWVPVIHFGRISSNIVLDNDKALQGRLADDTTIYNLAKVNTLNEVQLGATAASLTQVLGQVVQISPRLRLKATTAGLGYWDLLASGVSGTPRMTLAPVVGASVPAEFLLQTVNDSNLFNNFFFTRDGELRISNLVPTAPGDLVPLAYLESALASFVVAGIVAAGVVGVSGTTPELGGSLGVTGVTRVSTGIFRITLTNELSAVNNGVVHATVLSNNATSYGTSSFVVSKTVVQVNVFFASGGAAPHDGSFQFSVIDCGG